MLDQLRKYNKWANSLLLDAFLESAHLIPESCMLLFSHIANAQMIWTCRIKGIPSGVTVWQVNDLETCAEMLKQSDQILAQLNPDTEGKELIKYTTSNGDNYETSIYDILIHVFNHGTYHRAQIAKEMKLHHIKPINTDYIQFVRLGNTPE